MPRLSAGPVELRIGKIIEARRHELGLSQVALAGRLGVSWQGLQKLESGQMGVSVTRLLQLSQSLQLPVSTFLNSEAQREAEAEADDQFRAALFRHFKRVQDLRQRRRAVRLFATLVDILLDENTHDGSTSESSEHNGKGEMALKLAG